MMKRWSGLFLSIVLLLSLAASVQAKTVMRPDYAVGWQYTSVASGMSVKFPVAREVYIQPVFSLTLYDGVGKTEGSYAMALRGSVGFPTVHDLYPYIGLGLGHQRSFHGDSIVDAATDEERTGFQAFFGLEYRKHSFRPALELGITGISRSDGSLRVGTSVSFGVHYYF